MRIGCPYCGERDVQEFAYVGPAEPRRPDPLEAGAEEAFFDYVYLRDNPAGPLKELWYHAAGCRSWLVVDRDTRTHAMLGCALAADPGTMPDRPDGEADGS